MSSSRAGFHFRERMSGWVSTSAVGSPVTGAQQAEADREWAEVVLDVDYDDLEAVLRASDTAANVRGTALVAGLSPVAMEITGGTLQLFVHDLDHVQTWVMRYELTLLAVDGNEYTLSGRKPLHRGNALTAWPRTTTLYTEVSQGSTVVASGILHLTLPDFLRELSTMQVTPPCTRRQRLTGVPRFLWMFLMMLVRQFGGLLAGPWGFPPRPFDPPRGKPPASVETWWAIGKPPTPSWIHERDPGKLDPDVRDQHDREAWLRLRRYRGADATKGPVVLAPGFGMSTEAYVTDTISVNLTQFLTERGFDVWLFDYRANPEQDSARSNFTIDDVARVDWPTAIAQVHGVTEQKVQVFAHCVGSMSFQMAMLWGPNEQMRKQVDRAVCSQVTVHPVSSWFNTFKVRVKLGPVLERMSPLLYPNERRTPLSILYDVVLRVAPTPRGEGCGNAMCQWITAYFGLTHRHAQLNERTHDDMGRLFGVAGVHPLRHIGNMVAGRKSTDQYGNDVYLNSDREHVRGNAGRLALPILFLAGRENKIFFPETSKRTFRWLRLSNPDIPYRREVLDDYAHLDGIVGRDAHRDVFPIVAKFLEQPTFVRGPSVVSDSSVS